MTRREQLIDLIDEEAPRRLSDGRAIALLAAPFLLALALEAVGRWGDDSQPPLRMPWQSEERPDEPSTLVSRPGRGDLLRMARLPAYDQRFEERPVEPVLTDESGFRNPPSGLSNPFREAARDITLVGASFMVTGRFAESLAEHSGRTIYNTSWEGRGAIFPILHLLDNDSIGSAGEEVLVYGIVQRSLYSGLGFHHLIARLSESGSYHRPDSKSRLRAMARNWLQWSQRLDDYFLKTSPLVSEATRLSAYLPPMALDLGASSSVGLAQLPEPWSRPMLILGETLESVRRTFDERMGSTICEGLRRLNEHCKSRSVRLIVVLVPDKLQVFLDRLSPLNFAFSGSEARGENATTTVFARRLEELGVETVDLLPHFLTALETRAPDELLYRTDDTHWSRYGSRLAGEVVAERLNRQRPSD